MDARPIPPNPRTAYPPIRPAIVFDSVSLRFLRCTRHEITLLRSTFHLRATAPGVRSRTGEATMVHASHRRLWTRRALTLTAGLAALAVVFAGPTQLLRLEGQTKKAEKAEQKEKGDVVVGGGVEQVAFINEQIDQ